MPLRRWIWQAYARTALIPILLVEAALIVIYIGSNYWSREQHLAALRKEATDALVRIASQESAVIGESLRTVSQMTAVYAEQMSLALATPAGSAAEGATQYRKSPQGVYYKPTDDGGAAVYYSARTHVGPAEIEKMRRISVLDPFMRQVKAHNPLVVQIYFNSHDSLNRLFPYFDVLSQYDPNMDIPTFNFYYEADAEHNPARQPVWTDVYLDPAGQGWMASSIAPVYRGDFLEGVVGLDITVKTIIQSILDIPVPWKGYAMLLGKSGTTLALPPEGERDFQLSELLSHVYQQPVGQDTFKPEAFNILKRPELAGLAARIAGSTSGIGEADVNGKRFIAWHRVESAGWTLLVVAAEENIFEHVVRLSERLNLMGFWMVLALVFFYLVFFAVLFFRARKASRFIAHPLERIAGMIRAIGEREYEQPMPDFPVLELHQTARELCRTGAELGRLHRSLMSTQQQLDQNNRWLIGMFQVSPDGVVIFSEHGQLLHANPSFYRQAGMADRLIIGWSLETFWRELGQLTAYPEIPLSVPDTDGDFTLDLVRPKARTLQCSVRASNSARDGEALGHSLIVYLRDITELREVERIKGEFLAMAAHELRTPMTAIAGYAELISSREFEPELRNEMLRTILVNSRSLVNIINDLLDLGRLESRAGMDFHIVEQPLIPVVRQAMESLTNPAVNRSLELEIPDDMLGVNLPFDRQKFLQALTNILSNAAKYSPPDSLISVALKERADAVGVSVTDRGMGMSEETVQKIFDRFYRHDVTGHIAGTGLGMSLVKEIMDVHKGAVEIVSAPGAGSTVTLWLRRVGGLVGEEMPVPAAV